MHSSVDIECGLSCFRRQVGWMFDVHSSGNTDVACLVSGGELAWFLICTLLVTQMWPVLFQLVSWPGFIMYSLNDTECGLYCFSL